MLMMMSIAARTTYFTQQYCVASLILVDQRRAQAANSDFPDGLSDTLFDRVATSHFEFAAMQSALHGRHAVPSAVCRNGTRHMTPAPTARRPARLLVHAVIAVGATPLAASGTCSACGCPMQDVVQLWSYIDTPICCVRHNRAAAQPHQRSEMLH